jgi:hypothetical protein
MEPAKPERDDATTSPVYEVALDSFEYRVFLKPTNSEIRGITNAHTPMWVVLVDDVMICFVWATETSMIQGHYSIKEVIGVECTVNDLPEGSLRQK